MKMTLHRALAQRKTTKARIIKEIKAGTFIETTVGTSGKVKGTTITEAEKNILGCYDRILALIENFRKLSVSINEANNGIGEDTEHVHTVDFHGNQATLSSVLVTQETLRYRQQLLDCLTEQLVAVKNQVSRSEDDVERRCDMFLNSMGGGDKSVLSAADIDAYSKNFHQNNDLKLVDPLGLEKLIEQMKTQNETLAIECDSKISEINALTQIEVELG